MAITMALFSRLRVPLQAGLDTSHLLISARASDQGARLSPQRHQGSGESSKPTGMTVTLPKGYGMFSESLAGSLPPNGEPK